MLSVNTQRNTQPDSYDDGLVSKLIKAILDHLNIKDVDQEFVKHAVRKNYDMTDTVRNFLDKIKDV